MRATERYERAWNAFQIHLNQNPKASLIPFLKERHVNHRSMHRWMSEKGYSVRLAKQQIRLLQAEAREVFRSNSQGHWDDVPSPEMSSIPSREMIFGT